MAIKFRIGDKIGILKEKSKKEKLEKQSDPTRLKMNVCMIGPEGVGKTSVITSIYHKQKKTDSGANLFLTADAATDRVLSDKQNQLNQIFHGHHKEGSLITESKTSGECGEKIFHFTYGMNLEHTDINLEIFEYPVESLVTKPETVAGHIRQADAVLVAIDTPCLMEAGGRYHSGKNRPKLVEDFLMRYLNGEKEKIVLLMPLKCEKYYQQGEINAVTAKIQKEYSRLLTYLKNCKNPSTGKKNMCCAITPVQTLGGVVFDSFGKGENGKIRENRTRDGEVLPEKIHYHYTEVNAKYMAKHCEQPLYYLLAFMSGQSQKMKEEQGTFITEIKNLGTRKLDGTQGYRILFNGELLHKEI